MALSGTFPSQIGSNIDGLDRYYAREKVVDFIAKNGLLTRVDVDSDGSTPIPICQRSGDIVEPMLKKQWFLSLIGCGGLAKAALESMTELEIIPEYGRAICSNWLLRSHDWCLSRQINWGHRVPIFYDEKGNEVCANSSDEAKRLLATEHVHQDPDVLDTWFSSSLIPLAYSQPINVLITGHDILCPWVTRMVMMSLVLKQSLPFKKVLLHGLIVDEKGKKMSKSRGNVIDPIEVIDEFGIDAFRLACLSYHFKQEIIKMDAKRSFADGRRYVNKIWNACRFVLGILGDSDDAKFREIDLENDLRPIHDHRIAEEYVFIEHESIKYPDFSNQRLVYL